MDMSYKHMMQQARYEKCVLNGRLGTMALSILQRERERARERERENYAENGETPPCRAALTWYIDRPH